MTRSIIIAICGVTLAVILFIFFGFNENTKITGNTVFNKDTANIEQGGIVKEVIDGDTIVITFNDNKDRTIRLLGIDFPDIDKIKIQKWKDSGFDEIKLNYCYHKGIEDLKELILGKKVTLKFDNNERNIDTYGRILAYVYYENIFVEEYIVNKGYAVALDLSEPLCTECNKLKGLELKQGCLVE